MQGPTTVGIDDISAYIPDLYLPIADLAQARNLEYAKLNKGLGLTAMAVPDAHEDVATMAANAILPLLLRNGLKPEQIGRIYMGTESSVDGAKPMATYVLDMLNQYFEAEHGPDGFLHCDVVDLTFACIGAVDALENTLDWVRGGQDRIGIVVSADLARYELGSGGEYTQGAGAVAMLVKQQPRLLQVHDNWGVATRPVHDFFKPLRRFTKQQVIEEVLQLAGAKAQASQLLEKLQLGSTDSLLGQWDEQIELHRDTPVFDGPYSNDAYQQRIGEALGHYAAKAHLSAGEAWADDWHRLIFHLPYAYQARRMFSEIYLQESQRRGDWAATEAEIGQALPQPETFDSPAAYGKAMAGYLKAITKTERYRRFVAEKIEKGERASSLVGNLYTASLFLGLMSTLEADYADGQALAGKVFGFFAYGSGSKSKVFTATVAEGWKAVVAGFGLQQRLQDRDAIDYATYERLHRGQQKQSVKAPKGRFCLKRIERAPGVREGLREYAWQGGVHEPVFTP